MNNFFYIMEASSLRSEYLRGVDNGLLRKVKCRGWL
jgi:hypothetical protein